MRPYVIIFSTMTVDGKIANSDGYSKLSCIDDFRLQHYLRSNSDGVMVGANTVINDDPSLTVRLVKGTSPYKIIVDSKLIVPLSSKIFQNPAKSIIITSNNLNKERYEKFEKIGVRIIKVDFNGVLDMVTALKNLYDIGIKRLMVEGGGHLNYSLLYNGLVDELWVTISPFAFGGGTSIFEKGILKEIKAEFYIKEIKNLCQNWVNIKYSILYPKKPLI
ncbi:2,5-diamino-6-hydroxy-4-(5-phosphoribosylamino)pyrimidine 1'-reductase [Caldisphaera lagunensis DSM 15908]|uniref:2,5-diamino-6-(ribosylamino)-4(3H)-pyrimidinone 5'-phosphate reductase n=1 Tax=Caldisphaera lagunensis (strain DSM 15908 / JCM 11604 / ANMR 0165 / IC-154) TaxID=1056495 RepID=L0AAV5_CALLD|nr:2,5-diamino-6-(ribosylamino)-4(3H)-pyrimidinone 5'-phosphate reductase [Caldisphaera lagunensis]AFZ70150.1 2,5-diamino-6-hydroxy-4-(5-phosphoribosylamino)pyrimidine 1'-reductase [Caldisphaera lagunensis DSM 15908]